MILPAYYLILALPIFLLFVFPRFKRSVGKRRSPPGPSGFPIIGNLHQFDSTNPPFYLWKLSKEYGPLMSMKLGSRPLVVISSARMAEETLKKNDLAFSGRYQLYSTKRLTYNFKDLAFSPLNDYWREMRKASIIRLFSAKQVQSFRPIREDEITRMMKQISMHASRLEVFNLSDMIISLTSTLICRVAFGKRYDKEGSEQKRFNEILLDVQSMLQGFFFSNYLPSLSWIDNFTGVIARLERTFKELDSFCQELIDEHLSSPNRSGSIEQNDLLTLLLQLREDKSTPVDLTMDHLKALLQNIFVAGTDTSAVAIIWAMTTLMKNPRIMTKVQEEIRGLVKNEGIVTEDDIQKLPYFKAVIKETFRLYSPVPLSLPRETTQKCIIDGYEIQPKTIIFVNIWAVSRDPEYWKNPHEFLPERFLDSTLDYKGQHFGFIPFGAGRRICPAISLATATVELGLANLLHSFDWELPLGMKKEDIDMEIFPGLAMHKKTPLCLVARNHN